MTPISPNELEDSLMNRMAPEPYALDKPDYVKQLLDDVFDTSEGRTKRHIECRIDSLRRTKVETAKLFYKFNDEEISRRVNVRLQ